MKEIAEIINKITLEGYCLSEIVEDKEYSRVIRACLQSELDRQENKALTLSELKERIGEPVWVECEEPHWIVIEKIHLAENCLNVLAANGTWYTNIEAKFDVICQFEGVDNCTFYKHKPNGGE